MDLGVACDAYCCEGTSQESHIRARRFLRESGKHGAKRPPFSRETPGGILAGLREGHDHERNLRTGTLRRPNVYGLELPAGKSVYSRSEATSNTVHRLVSSKPLLACVFVSTS